MRCFAALELTPALRSVLASIAARIEKQRGLTTTPPDNLHVTVKFLGDVGEEALPAIEQQLERVTADVQPFTLRLESIGAFPNAKRPRVVWAGLKDPDGDAVRLAAAIDGCLAPLGIPAEQRPFQPHITLARSKTIPAGKRLRAFLEEDIHLEAAELPVIDLTLFQSELTPNGAVYTALRHFRLGT